MAVGDGSRGAFENIYDLAELLGELAGQQRAELIGEAAIVPERPLFGLAESVPDFFADLFFAKVAQDRSRIVNFVGQ